jgi:uncharacterized SAM-binding protein YcdF (DUF218 family)
LKTKYCLLILLLLSAMSGALARKGPGKALQKAAGLIPFDAVIIPGVPYNGRSWDSVMKARVLWSFILYKNGYVRNIIYSGGAVYTPYYEAKIMGLYARALGIPARNIFYDTAARHSTENVYYSYLLARKLGFKTIALGTDPFQSFMLHGFTRRRFGSPIYHLPFIIDSLAVYNSARPVINPASAKAANWTSLKDQQSALQRFRGTIGRTINWGKYPGGRVPAL